MGRRGDVQEGPGRLPGAAGARGPRALRLLRAPAGRQARGLRSRARLHAARLRADAGALDRLRRGGPRGQARGALLRAHRGGRGDHRPRGRPPQPQLHHRRAAGADRARLARGKPGVLGVVRARPARRRARLRARGQRGALHGPAAIDLRRAGRDPHRPRRHGDRVAHRRDLPRGAQGRAADLRRRLHGDPVPAGGERRCPRLAHREPVHRRARARRGAAGAADHLLDLRRLHRRRPRRRPGDDARDLPAGVRVPDLPAPLARGGRREPAHPPVPARRRRGGDRADRGGHGRASSRPASSTSTRRPWRWERSRRCNAGTAS